jgi:tetratricopeptide (TPR) repeat protein
MRKPAGLLVLALACVSACAPKTVPLPVVQSPKFPEFVRPATPPEYVNAPAGRGLDRAWRFLQAGDVKNADLEISGVLRLIPSWPPAETAQGYVELARQDAKAALVRFDRVLVRQTANASALAGRGESLIALGRPADALAAFEAALAANPSLTEIARRIDVLKFRVEEERLASARGAVRAGRVDEALRAYGAAIAASPDSSFLYRERADVEHRSGDDDSALADWRKAVQLDPADAKSLEQIGDLLDARGEIDGALRALTNAASIEPRPDLEQKIERLRAKSIDVRLPAQYRAIEHAAEVTRADVAALIGIRLAPLIDGSARKAAVPMTDIRGHWASTWILAVTRAGVMEPFANHTFQPRGVMHRLDFAETMAHLLVRVRALHPAEGKAWESARLKFTDLAATNLAYVPVSQTVAAGVLKAGADNRFQPAKPVSGPEAIEAVARIEALAGLPASAGQPR